MADVITASPDSLSTVTPKELARRLHCSYPVVLRAIQDGSIPSLRFGQRRRVSVRTMEALLLNAAPAR